MHSADPHPYVRNVRTVKLHEVPSRSQHLPCTTQRPEHVNLPSQCLIVTLLKVWVNQKTDAEPWRPSHAKRPCYLFVMFALHQSLHLQLATLRLAVRAAKTSARPLLNLPSQCPH